MTRLIAPILESAGWLSIAGNPALTAPNFPVLHTLTDLHVSETPLPSFAGFESLTDITWTMSVANMENLENLNGLNNLEAVGHSLSVWYNDALTDISALSGVGAVGHDLVIQANPILPTSLAWDLVDAIGEDNIGGTVQIIDNGPD